MASESAKNIFIFSKKGDGGTTSLLSGERVSKASLRPEAYGTLDEVSSILGIIKALIKEESLKNVLDKIQKDLVILGAELASTEENPKYKISEEAIKYLELWIEKLQEKVPLPRHFVQAGATFEGAFVDLARTTTRRAERRIASLRDAGEPIRDEASSYINRLADFLFTMARYLDGTS